MKARLKTLPDKPRGGAWPSSARAVKCPVKSGNERDPHLQLPPVPPGAEHNGETARVKWEEGGGDGRSVCPEFPGPHAAYNGRDNEMPPRKGALIP